MAERSRPFRERGETQESIPPSVLHECKGVSPFFPRKLLETYFRLREKDVRGFRGQGTLRLNGPKKTKTKRVLRSTGAVRSRVLIIQTKGALRSRGLRIKLEGALTSRGPRTKGSEIMVRGRLGLRRVKTVRSTLAGGVVWCCAWCGAVRCGVVWSGVVWCGVVWCGVERV